MKRKYALTMKRKYPPTVIDLGFGASTGKVPVVSPCVSVLIGVSEEVQMISKDKNPDDGRICGSRKECWDLTHAL